MKYIKLIDGLRGLSVLVVLFFHLNIGIFEGGFIGVDIFFVISGFLITGIIVDSIDNSRFKLQTFYLRRIKRLLPPLYVMLIFVAIFSLFFFLPHEIKDIYQAIVATTIYLSNVFNYREIDYFNTFHAKSPLLHTWSLSVEEQFYFVYPIILFLLRKYVSKKTILILFCFVLLSFGASVFYGFKDPLYIFYYPWFRGWELGLGGIAFLFCKSSNFVEKYRKYNSRGIYNLSLLVILVSVIFCRDDKYIPNFGAFPAVFATCLILINCMLSDQKFILLDNRFLVFTGTISYSLYLWHQPILAFVYAINDSLGTFDRAIVVVVSFLMAYLSWRFVEKPIRHSNFKPVYIWITTGVISLSLVAVGLYGHYTDGFMKYFLRNLKNTDREWVINRDVVFAKRDSIWKNIQSINASRSLEYISDVDYLIIGDSKGEDLLTTFYLNDSIQKSNKFYYLRIDDEDMGKITAPSANGLLPVSGNSTVDEAFKMLNSLTVKRVKNIILTCTWQDKSNEGVIKFVEFLSTRANHIYVLSTANWNDVTSLSFKMAQLKMSESSAQKFLFNNLRDDWKRQSDNLHKLIPSFANLTWVDKENAFCNTRLKTCTLFSKKKEFYIYDSGHLTDVGAKFFGEFIWDNNWFGVTNN